MNSAPNNIISDIHNLSYQQLEDLEKVITVRKKDLFPTYLNDIEEKYQERYKEHQIKRKHFEQEILPKIKEYLIKNLAPNKSIIKVKGARDGKGIRLFLKWFDAGEDLRLECRQIKIYKRFWPKHESGNITEELGQITEHMVDKVTHIKINEEFVPIKELI